MHLASPSAYDIVVSVTPIKKESSMLKHFISITACISISFVAQCQESPKLSMMGQAIRYGFKNLCPESYVTGADAHIIADKITKTINRMKGNFIELTEVEYDHLAHKYPEHVRVATQIIVYYYHYRKFGYLMELLKKIPRIFILTQLNTAILKGYAEELNKQTTNGITIPAPSLDDAFLLRSTSSTSNAHETNAWLFNSSLVMRSFDPMAYVTDQEATHVNETLATLLQLMNKQYVSLNTAYTPQRTYYDLLYNRLTKRIATATSLLVDAYQHKKMSVLKNCKTNIPEAFILYDLIDPINKAIQVEQEIVQRNISYATDEIKKLQNAEPEQQKPSDNPLLPGIYGINIKTSLDNAGSDNSGN
jgi:hypothetical protein